MPATPAFVPAAVRLWPAADRPALRNAALALAGTALLAAAAHVQVPFWPVKLSLQSFVVVMIGAVYGARLAGATLLAYLAEGALGLPVFQSGAGLAYMAGPTAGYLLGYVLAAALTGLAAERGWLARFPLALATVLAAAALIYLPGLAWLAVLFGPAKAVPYGLTPFIPGEAAKMALVLALVPFVWPVAR